MGYTYIKKYFVVYLKCKFHWLPVFLFAKSDSPSFCHIPLDLILSCHLLFLLHCPLSFSNVSVTSSVNHALGHSLPLVPHSLPGLSLLSASNHIQSGFSAGWSFWKLPFSHLLPHTLVQGKQDPHDPSPQPSLCPDLILLLSSMNSVHCFPPLASTMAQPPLSYLSGHFVLVSVLVSLPL